jgi:hypothetical protein
MRSLEFRLSIFSLLALFACNETVIKHSSSPNINSSTCGAQPISFASVNTQIFIRNCTVNGCHAGGSLNLTTYEGVRANLAQVKDSVLGNRMPPMGPLSVQDKELLVTWINQGAPLRAEDAVIDCLPNESEVNPEPEVEPQPEPLLQPTYESLKIEVFAQNCLGCHGAGSRIGDFASYEAITGSGQSDLFNREDPGRSEFVLRLVAEGNGLMPPPRSGLAPLSPEVVEVIKTWISNGMPRE